MNIGMDEKKLYQVLTEPKAGVGLMPECKNCQLALLCLGSPPQYLRQCPQCFAVQFVEWVENPMPYYDKSIMGYIGFTCPCSTMRLHMQWHTCQLNPTRQKQDD